MTLPQELADLFDTASGGPVLVHSDLFLASGFVATALDRRQLLQQHIALLSECAATRALWMPTFNYDFPKSRQFNVESSPCQLGPLGEHFRTAVAAWRTADPIFSVAGTQLKPEVPSSGRIDPFGPASIFAALENAKGFILFYGAPLSSATMIHYVERKSGGPMYRYDKIFRGFVTCGSDLREVEYVYHVRPFNRGLEYDWERIHADLSAACLLHPIQKGSRAVAILMDAAAMSDYLCKRLRDDPLYLLDASSRAWVEVDLARLGRRFRLEDFEVPA